MQTVRDRPGRIASNRLEKEACRPESRVIQDGLYVYMEEHRLRSIVTKVSDAIGLKWSAFSLEAFALIQT